MKTKEEVQVELCRGARCVRQFDGEPEFGIGDIFVAPEDGLVRIHFISEATGDAYYRPLTIGQRLGFYYRKVFR